MLKSVIDIYNFLLDILDSFKRPSLTIKSSFFGISALAALLFSILSVQALGGGSGSNKDTDRTADTQATALTAQDTQAQQQVDKPAGASKTTVNRQDAPKETKKQTTTDKPKSVSQQESTASKSFRLSVKQDSKYPVGTLIVFDAIKNDKIYYAGDLQFSTDSLTISKSAVTAANTVRISSPDGASIGVPAEPNDDKMANMSISLDASQPNDPGSGYNMIVEASSQLEPGTYVLHVAAAKTNPTSDSWWYHGFLTVNVTE